MPGQVFQVVQCYSCHTFQVQQRKKVNKWVCKMCGEKQSIKKVYGEGSGADCRVHVQKLNTLRGELDHSQQLAIRQPAHREPEMGQPDLGHSDLQYRQDDQATSRWGQFMDAAAHTEEGSDDDDNDHRWTTDSNMYKESMKRSMKRKKSQSGTCRSRLKGDNPFPSTYTNHSPCSWDDHNSLTEHREIENVTGDELYHEYQSADDNKCHLQRPEQRLQNSSHSSVGLCSESVGTVMTSVQRKQKTSNQGAAVNSKWSTFIDNEESDDSDCSESTMRFGKSELNREHAEYDSSSLLVDGQGASRKWSVFVDGVPTKPSLSQDDSSKTEASNSTLRSCGKVSRVSMTCYDGDNVIDQLCNRELSKGHSNGQKPWSKICDKYGGGPGHRRENTDSDRCELVPVEGKENILHKQTSSIFSVGDVNDVDLEIDF